MPLHPAPGYARLQDGGEEMDTMVYLVGYFQLAAAFLWPFALLGVTIYTFMGIRRLAE